MLSVEDVRRARTILKHLVPIELADIILHFARYYPTISRCAVPRSVSDADVPIITVELENEQAEGVIEVSLEIHGHDQGWSSYPRDHGTTSNSWTWYSLGTEDPESHEERLAVNLHAQSETQVHERFWNKNSKVVQNLRRDRVISIWAHAR